MGAPGNPRVTARDQAIMARRAAALAAAERDDEGTPEWRASVIEGLDRRRRERGIDPLKEWWQAKPEVELHRRARSLGLLRPVR